MKLLQTLKRHLTWEIILVIVLLTVSGVAHGVNMFHFPYYENDEGVYMSQAWSLIKFGKLAPYTYWYDHAPAGWIFIALWNLLTGGVFTFGFSINSGRVFMLILHVFSSAFLYAIVKKLTSSKLAAATSVLVFALSPLGIYFQRRVLLDNIMVFWLLLSLTLILYYKNKLRNIILSALTFGIAILSKETAIFFIPVFLYILSTTLHTKHRVFAIVKWLSILGLTVGIYFLYALLKGEFFPYGTFLGGAHDHVSLIDALKFQATRKGGSIFDTVNGSFWTNMRIWLNEDPAIIYAGFAATFINLLIGVKKYPARVISLISLSYMFFLSRGGLVIEFYVIPLIPLLAMNIGTVASYSIIGLKRILKYKYVSYLSYIPALSLCIGLVISSLFFSTKVRSILNLYTSDQTTPQIQAVDWLLKNKTPNTFYVIDNYGYIDLQERKHDDTIRTEWYWKVDRDPDVRDKMLHQNKNNIDYVALTPQMKNDIAYSGLGLTLAAWKNSQPITDFSNNRWDVDFWGGVQPTRVLKATFDYYKNAFIKNGRVIDPYDNNNTTSEGQSYALLRSVWSNDKTTFDSVLNWSSSHLKNGNTYAWKWIGSDTNGNIADGSNATDADQDIALSLLFAYKKWGDATYLNSAKAIIDGIWQNNIVYIDDNPILVPGKWANTPEKVVINPSYFSPANYRIFAAVDSTHPWYKVVDSSYTLLKLCTSARLDVKSGVLPPEWCAIDKVTHIVGASTAPQPTSSDYSYNAFRTPWRIALDYVWNKDVRAKQYLSSLSFLSQEWKTNQRLLASYQHDGTVRENYESVAAYSGDLGYFMIIDPINAKKIYEDKIFKKFYENRNQSYWDDPKNYYTQNWAWFSTALYSNNLPNLWK